LRMRHLDLRAAVPSTRLCDAERKRVLTEVEVRLRFEAKVVAPCVPEISKIPPHPIVPAVDRAAHRRERRNTHAARIAERDHGLDVVRVERLEPAAQELDVALRHARSPRRVLLRSEAEVGERAVAVEVENQSRDPAVTDVEQA